MSLDLSKSELIAKPLASKRYFRFVIFKFLVIVSYLDFNYLNFYTILSTFSVDQNKNILRVKDKRSLHLSLA